MKKLALPLTLFAAVLFSDAMSQAAPTQVAPPPAPSVQKVAPSAMKIKAAPKLTAQQTLAVPGEKRTVKATLLAAAGQPLVGRKINFTFKGKSKGKDVTIPIGGDKTDAQGLANVDWSVPELDQGPGKLIAQSESDDEYLSVKDEANFGIIKGITKITLDNLVGGSLDAHGSPGDWYPTIIIHLTRTADNMPLAKPLWLTVNGNRRQINQGTNPSSFNQILLTPTDAHHWDVKVEFEGDEANQSSMATRSYSH